MKSPVLFVLLAALPLVRADATDDAVLAKSGRSSTLMNLYERRIAQIEAERSKALIDANEKMIGELNRVKSEALRSENLALANAANKKITELNARNIELKGVKETPKVEEVHLSGIPNEIIKWSKRSGLSTAQKEVVQKFARGELAISNSSRSHYYYFKNEKLFKGLNSTDPIESSWDKDHISLPDGWTIGFYQDNPGLWHNGRYLASDPQWVKVGEYATKKAPEPKTQKNDDLNDTPFGRRER